MIVFSDMDGTFLTSEKQVSEECRAALDALAARGIEFVPCTGRSLAGVPTELLEHPAVHYAVSSNGAVVAELDTCAKSDLSRARIIRSTPLSREKAHAVLGIARGYDVTFDVFADGNCYLRRDLYERIPEFVPDVNIARSMLSNRIPVDEEPEVTIDRVEVLERVAMYWRDERDRDAILAELKRVPEIEVTRSYAMNIEVMEAGTSKGTALAWLCAHLGIDRAEAVAFGDNMNDVSMIELAGTGVAMANAEAEVRSSADRVAPTNDEAGVAKTIMELLGA